MHIVQVFPHGWECSCGEKGPDDPLDHIIENTPGMITDRRRCSKKCRDGFFERTFQNSHDEDCPMNQGVSNG